MSLRAEIETYRRQIASAFAEYNRRGLPKVTKFPKGLFNQRQLERWQRAETLIGTTVREFLADLGIMNYVLEQDFSRSTKYPSNKQVDFTLKFREGEPEGGWNEETPYKEVFFHYDAGGRLNSKRIAAYSIFLAVPRKKRNTSWFTIEEASRWMNQPDADTFCCAGVESTDVNRKNIENLLRLILANPKVVHPEEEFVPR